MKTLALLAAALLLVATPALADAPKFTATCPGGKQVKSNGKGKVRIDGVKAAVKKLSPTSWQASAGSTRIDIGRDGSKIYVSANGSEVCEVTKGSSGENVASVPVADQQACLAAVSRKANNGRVAILDATSSEANNAVIVGVGKQKARWQCLVKKGRVAEVMSLTDEGGL